jgi:hypothetical protein
MATELNWTSIAETFIKSIFGYLSKKCKSRRSNGDDSSKKLGPLSGAPLKEEESLAEQIRP